MILKNSIRIICFATILSLIILSTDSGYGESLLRNKYLSDKHSKNNIPQGVYTYNYKSLHVKDTDENHGRLILKSYLSLNIKSSWSSISNHIAFIQVPLTDLLRNFEKWTPSICVIKSDGSNFKRLTNGKFGDFNPTWIRSKEEIVFTRLDQTKKHYAIYYTTPEIVPGQEVLVSDPKFNESCGTSISDGGLLIQSDRSGTNEFYLLEIARHKDGTVRGQTGKYLKIEVEMPETPSKKRIVRESISPDGTKLVFEYSDNVWDMEKSVIYYSDLDIHSKPPRIFNVRPIVPLKKSYTTIYPKWTDQSNAVLFISNQTGKYQIYQYTISTGTTKRLSPNNDADYTYFCPKNIPN